MDRGLRDIRKINNKCMFGKSGITIDSNTKQGHVEGDSQVHGSDESNMLYQTFFSFCLCDVSVSVFCLFVSYWLVYFHSPLQYKYFIVYLLFLSF